MLKPVKSLKPFLKHDEINKKYIFTGDRLEVRIPKRFEVYGLLDVSDSVRALGIMALIINEEFTASLKILASIEIFPTEIKETVIDGTPYLVLTLFNGDILINNTEVTQEGNVIYATYVESITRGRPLYTLDYVAMGLLFDRAKQTAGAGIGVDRSLYELNVAHLARDPQNLQRQYRYTDMTMPHQMVPMRSVFYAPTNTSTRVIGSYSDDGMTAALQTRVTTPQPFEDILRGIPQSI